MLLINSSVFIAYNFRYVINCLNINCVTIYTEKCLGIVTLKALLTTCFRYNSEKLSSKFLIPKMKLSRIEMRLLVEVLL